MLSVPAPISVVSTPNTFNGSPWIPLVDVDSAVVTYLHFSESVYDAPDETTESVAPGTPATTVAAVFDAIAVMR